jgi:hypothetical protein
MQNFWLNLPDERVVKIVKITRQNCNITTLGGGAVCPTPHNPPIVTAQRYGAKYVYLGGIFPLKGFASLK